MSDDCVQHLVQQPVDAPLHLGRYLRWLADQRAKIGRKPDVSMPATIAREDGAVGVAVGSRDEEFYIDYIEQERQALIREAAKNHRAKEEPEPETEEEDLEPVILPHIVDRMETQEKSQSGRLNQSELMADLNI